MAKITFAINKYTVTDMRIYTAGLPFILSLVLLFSYGNLEAQDLDTLSVHSKLVLSPLLGEISGMCFQDDDIYAINDGGNGAYVFKIDIHTGELKEEFRFFNIRNHDWEELSLYNGYLYIADLGNNYGIRKDLAIHRISLDSLNERNPPVLTTGMKYLMQKEFRGGMHNHEWDCEAMVVTADGIICFSKNWVDQITKMYIANEGEDNVLRAVDTFNAGFLVTGAYYQSPEKSMYLCGYYKNEPYLLHFKNVDEMGFSEDYIKYVIPELKFTQIESIFVRGKYIYLASERTIIGPAIYRIEVSGLR